MKVHWLQHVPFEGLACLETVFSELGFACTSTHLYRGDRLPEVASVDAIVALGGPMGVHDEQHHAWLSAEKAFLSEAIESGRHVLGICLGAQLMADVLGAAVTSNIHREIGWFPIQRRPEALSTRIGRILPDEMQAFHWHGDRFEIPDGAIPLASSEACENQGFVLNDRVIGLQFHLEATPATAQRLIENCINDLDGTCYTQNTYEILRNHERFDKINAVMRRLVIAWTDSAG